MILLLISILTIIILFILYKRRKKYKYNQKKDYKYDLSQHFLAAKVIENKNKLDLKDINIDYDTLILEIELDQSFISNIFKPYIQINEVKHYFEYGAKGNRYLNISSLNAKEITFSFHNAKLKTKEIKIYGYKNYVNLEKKILILAPHADDAEIAAFGLYKTAKDVTIVTTTMGEHGVCNYCDFYDGDRTKAAQKKAHLRLLDSLHIPSFGNVGIENSLALGYFGGSLEFMYNNEDKNASSHVKDFGSMQKYRKVSHGKVKLNQNIDPNFKAFYNDIKELLIQLQPEIIITPHPQIDSHPDHKYTTLSLFKVLDEVRLNTKILLYTNHLKESESYPIGKMFGSVDLPVNYNAFNYDGIYSFILSNELQKEKYFALEAIHDLRDSFLPISLKRAYKHYNKLLKRELITKDKSYFRRAVRKHELFFTLKSEHIKKFLQEK